MSKIEDLVPEKVIKTIKDYLRKKCLTSYPNSFRRNQSDEDSITASFFENLAKNPEIIFTNSEKWIWSIEYSTTSSRGIKPLETALGADVILFIEIILENGVVFRKGILIQSKIEGKFNRLELENQVNKMESFVNNSSVVLTYRESRFNCSTGKEFLFNEKKQWRTYSSSFCDFLADQFLECKYGVIDLYYDFAKREATYIDKNGNRILYIPERGVTEIQIREIKDYL